MIRVIKGFVPLSCALCLFACDRTASENASVGTDNAAVTSDSTPERDAPPAGTPREKVDRSTLEFVLEMEKGQAEMNQEAGAGMREAETEMNGLLARLQASIRGTGPRSVKARQLLETSQKAWSEYARAQIALEWPNPESGNYGSVHEMCVVGRLTVLLHARVRELKDMLEHEEGDVCQSAWPDEVD